MASKCTITFDNNPFGVYYAGQVVAGTAELITLRPKTIRSIFITISGFAETRWTENITKQDTHGKPEKALETYSASEMYYSNEQYVYGQSGGAQLELPAGKYVFPFQATIPPNAPTSFNGSFGQITHEVTMVIDRVMRYNNTFKQCYSVISPFDLNLNAEHNKPLQKIEEKTFCWSLCCGAKGPMVMHVKVPFAAYAPGQKVRFNIVLDNQSDVHCSDVKVRLVKKVTYTSRSPETKTQITEIKVADNHCGEVVKFNKAEFNEFLQIPSTTPTSLSGCSIIKINYMIHFIAKVFRIHGDLVIEFPMTIGTVPLYASANDQGPVTTQPAGGPSYKPLSPPMFEEDVRSEQFESNTFKPRYPVFLNDASVANTNNSSVPTSVIIPGPKLTPNPITLPVVSPSPTPKPTPHLPSPKPTPYPIASPGASPTPYPIGPTASKQTPYPTGPPVAKQMNGEPPLEILGFSIPPDYKPTPTAPNADGSGNNVGWK